MKTLHNVHGWINNEIPAEGEQYLVAHGGELVGGVLIGAGGHTAIYTTVEPTPDPIRIISTEAFRRRFTKDELKEMRKGNASDDIQYVYEGLTVGDKKDLDGTFTIDDMQILVDATIISPERKTELLAGGTEAELPI